MSYDYVLEDNKKKTYSNQIGRNLNSTFITVNSTMENCSRNIGVTQNDLVFHMRYCEFSNPKFSEYINYQLTLARMDAMDEIERAGNNYGGNTTSVTSYYGALEALEKAYAKKKSRESLEDITNADELHKELYKLEHGLLGSVKNKIKDFFMMPERVLSLDSIEERQRLQSYEMIFLSKQ